MITIDVEDNFRKVGGSSLKGYLTATYEELVDLFTYPLLGDEYKTDAEWVLSVTVAGQDGEERGLITIYNWKNGKSYCGSSGIPVELITDWNVGGKQATLGGIGTVEILERVLAAYRSGKASIARRLGQVVVE